MRGDRIARALELFDSAPALGAGRIAVSTDLTVTAAESADKDCMAIPPACTHPGALEVTDVSLDREDRGVGATSFKFLQAALPDSISRSLIWIALFNVVARASQRLSN